MAGTTDSNAIHNTHGWDLGLETLEAKEQIERQWQVDAQTQSKPKIVARLNDWQYLERSIHRLIAAWGRSFAEWDDKIAMHRHIWEQAECVRRLRERLAQFPGSTHNAEMPVSSKLERLVNTVLLAPSHQDAVDGIYGILTGALTRSYLFYASGAHPVHDAPTLAMLHEIVAIKEQMRLWLREYRRRHPHQIEADYQAAIEREIRNCNDLRDALESEGEAAAAAGLNTDFRLPVVAGRPRASRPAHDIRPFIDADFQNSVETRRLFWAWGYMMEINLAEDQLRWIYDAHGMPWEFLQDISRHLWDESRHGDSGHSRLVDFGITLDEIGFGRYHPDPGDEAHDLAQRFAPMSAKELYDTVFFIGMIAETGHFAVKREAYEDFKAGGDRESAEMMLFDIIDESAHVQYAHRWLPLLAERAGIDNSDYRERAVKIREEHQQKHNESKAEKQSQLDRQSPAGKFYQELLQRMREQQPLSNAETAPLRSPLPM